MYGTCTSHELMATVHGLQSESSGNVPERSGTGGKIRESVAFETPTLTNDEHGLVVKLKCNHDSI